MQQNNPPTNNNNKDNNMAKLFITATLLVIAGLFAMFGFRSVDDNSSSNSGNTQLTNTVVSATTTATVQQRRDAVGEPLGVSVPNVKNESLVEDSPSANYKKVYPLYINGARTVPLIGVVGSNALFAADRIAELAAKSNEPIWLILSGPGGSVLSGSMLISAIQASKAPVYTVCVMLCASMDAMIHQYGAKRYMVDRTWIMFHPASGGAGGEVDKMFSMIRFVKGYITKIEYEIAAKQKLSYEDYKAKTSIEMWLDSEEAVTNSVAEAIVNIIPTKRFNIIDSDEEETEERYKKMTPSYTQGPDIQWICARCVEGFKWEILKNSWFSR